jgi:ribosomal protein L37AE/L43A
VSVSSHLGWYDTNPDAYELMHNVWWINIGLLIFNMMPIYPLDGGQILRSLLWFPFWSREQFAGCEHHRFYRRGGIDRAGDFAQSIWLGIMAAFILMNCWSGLKQARALARIAKLPRREGFACPSCKTAPPLGELWRCGKCGQAFDTFLTQGVCPHCGRNSTRRNAWTAALRGQSA